MSIILALINFSGWVVHSCMKEFQVSLFATEDGGYALDVQPIGSSGTSPYVKFKNWDEVIGFLDSFGLSKEMMQEVEEVSETLKKGHVFHQQMFLPPAISDRVDDMSEARR